MSEIFRIKMKIKKMEANFMRDRWGNLKKCYWNKMYKEDILKLEARLKELESTHIKNIDKVK